MKTVKNQYLRMRKIGRYVADLINYIIFCVRIGSFSPHRKLRDIGAVILIDPNMINQFVANEALAERVKNKIKEKQVIVSPVLKSVSGMDIIVAYQDVFLAGFDWRNTAFYNRVAFEIQNGKKKFGCNSIVEFNKRLKEDEKHFAKIKNFGYKSQWELGSLKPWDEVRVIKCKDGSYAFIDGRHRLATARILEVKSIPILICGIEQ